MKFVLATITEQSGEEQYDSQFLVCLNVDWEFEDFDFLLLNIYSAESISGFQSDNRDSLELESSYRIVRREQTRALLAAKMHRFYKIIFTSSHWSLKK
jgi:hypothetical protein